MPVMTAAGEFVSQRRPLRRGARILLAAAIPVAGGALLVGEALLATRGASPGDPPARHPDPDPARHPDPDADVGEGPGQGETPVVVVWLGDSTAAGVGASVVSATLPEQVTVALGQRVRLTVLAHSGDRVADVVRSQLPKVASLRPSVAFVSVGANDVTHLTSRGRFKSDYRQVLVGLPPSVSQVVLLGVPDMGAPPRLAEPLRAVAGWRGRVLDADVRALAHRYRSRYVDIAGATGPSFRRYPKQYFAVDGYHPNDAGYQLWARAVAESPQ